MSGQANRSSVARRADRNVIQRSQSGQTRLRKITPRRKTRRFNLQFSAYRRFISCASKPLFLPRCSLSSVTSVEIAADLQAWSSAALSEVTRQEETPEVFGTDYRERYANYLRLQEGASAKKAVR